MSFAITQLQAATDDLYLNTEPVDIKFVENVLLYFLIRQAIGDPSMPFDEYFVKPEETLDGGKTIKVPLEYDDSNYGSYGDTVIIPRDKVDIINAAKFGWGGIYASNALGLQDSIENAGPNAIVKLADRYIQNVLKSGYKAMAAAIFTRTAGDNDAIKALSDLFSTTTSTAYGNIAEDDMALWKANVNTDGSEIGFQYLQKLHRTPAIGQSSKKRPNLYVTTETLKDSFEMTLQTQQRFGSDQKLVDVGFDNIRFKGAVVCADDLVSSGYVYGLNTLYLKLKAHQDFNWTTPEWIAMKESGQPDKKYVNSRFIGQLVCTNRKAHIQATGVQEAS